MRSGVDDKKMRFKMIKKVTYRVLIFDDEEMIRRMLWSYFDSRGYEVFTFPHPASCPLEEAPVCPCPDNAYCADIIMSDLNMPIKKGLDFLDEQVQKGCRCGNLALMSADVLKEDADRAKALNVKLLLKPFTIRTLGEWISDVEKRIDPNRKLSDWFINH